MRWLAAVQAGGRRGRALRAVFVTVAVLGFAGGYAGHPRLPLFERALRVTVTPLPTPPADQRRWGRLTWLGGATLRSPDPAFGGFSAMSVRPLADGRRFTLLNDGGNVVRIVLDDRWRPRELAAGALPAGPRTGWEKRDRDTESFALAPDCTAWVGFESANAIWRYAPGFALPAKGVRPWAMRRWNGNGGAEALVRLRDGRFVVFAETARWRGRSDRAGIVFRGDPVRRPGNGFGFSYRPAPGYDPTDAVQLPSGDLLVLERRWQLPIRFRSRLAIVPLAALRPGATVEGREVARLAPPFPTENYEGLAVTRERGATIVWLASDDDQMFWRNGYLMKFRLEPETTAARPPRGRRAAP